MKEGLLKYYSQQSKSVQRPYWGNPGGLKIGVEARVGTRPDQMDRPVWESKLVGWSVVGLMVGRWPGFGRSVVGFWSVLPTHSKKFGSQECSRRKSGVLKFYFYICLKLLTLPNNDLYIFRHYFLILMSFFWLNWLQKFRPTDRPNHRPDPTDPTFKIEVFGESDPTRLPI